jgi:hypothetical protein
MASDREDAPNNGALNAFAKSIPANAAKIDLLSITFARNCIS